MLAQFQKERKIKSRHNLILAGILLAIGIALAVWMLKCPGKIFTSIGKFETKDSGLRAAILKLATEISECPKAEEYRIAWVGPDLQKNDGAQRRSLLYIRESKLLGYESDALSGFDGKRYTVNDAAIKEVAEKRGTLEDFAEHDKSSK